jgi:dihydrofolate reductase
MISIIAAVADGNAIGKDNALLWHISEDLKYFKKITSGHSVIMGRKTFESIGRPLPGRKNIVVSRSPLDRDDVEQAFDLEALLKSLSRKRKEEFFVIGGGSVYASALKYARKLYITRVYSKADGADAFFPEIDEKKWDIVEKSEVLHDQENNIDFQFIVYGKKAKRIV